MSCAHRVTLLLGLVTTLFAALIHPGPASALTPEEATRVGGDPTPLGNKLAKLHEAGAKVLDAAPGAYRELGAASAGADKAGA